MRESACARDVSGRVCQPCLESSVWQGTTGLWVERPWRPGESGSEGNLIKRNSGSVTPSILSAWTAIAITASEYTKAAACPEKKENIRGETEPVGEMDRLGRARNR